MDDSHVDTAREALASAQTGWNRYFLVQFGLTFALLLDGGTFLADQTTIEFLGLDIPRVALSASLSITLVCFSHWAQSSAKVIAALISQLAPEQRSRLGGSPECVLWWISPIHPSIFHRFAFWAVAVGGVFYLIAVTGIHLLGKPPDTDIMPPVVYRIIGVFSGLSTIIAGILAGSIARDWTAVGSALRHPGS